MSSTSPASTRASRQAALEGIDFIEADIRNPVIAKLIAPTRVDTIVHNQIVRRPATEGYSARKAHDVNVIGSLQLLAACEKAETVEGDRDPRIGGHLRRRAGRAAVLHRGHVAPLSAAARFQRDVGEIENLFETYRRRHPQVTCTMLRYQPTIGTTQDTQVTRYLSMPVVPTYLGFDPVLPVRARARCRWTAFVAAVKNPVRGAVNVAAPGTIGPDADRPDGGEADAPCWSRRCSHRRDRGTPGSGSSDFSPDFRRLQTGGAVINGVNGNGASGGTGTATAVGSNAGPDNITIQVNAFGGNGGQGEGSGFAGGNGGAGILGTGISAISTGSGNVAASGTMLGGSGGFGANGADGGQRRQCDDRLDRGERIDDGVPDAVSESGRRQQRWKQWWSGGPGRQCQFDDEPGTEWGGHAHAAKSCPGGQWR